MIQNKTLAGLVGLGLSIGLPGIAHGGPNLVTNGSFEQTTGGSGQLNFNTTVTGWTSSPYYIDNMGDYVDSFNFLFTPGSADTTGITGGGAAGTFSLWGPNNGSNNGLPASSPDGGNFIGSDGAFEAAPLSQTISGLTVGAKYNVSFYWAGAQVYGYSGPTTDQWQVSLGSQTQSTSVYSNPGKGFSGWTKQTFTFTADSTSDALSFLAVGTPISPSEPPFSLLDGVSMTAVPEASTWVAMCVFVGGFGVFVRRRARAAKTVS